MYDPENITEIHQNTNDGITNAHRILCNGVLLGIVLSYLADKGLNTMHCTAATRIAMDFFYYLHGNCSALHELATLGSDR